MSERAPLPEVPPRLSAGRLLPVALHPDDDVIGPGGTLALHGEAFAPPGSPPEHDRVPVEALWAEDRGRAEG